ncbi:hypothetical protein BAY22_00010 [Yersinia pestis]|nr:hypothetical protein BAY22_00010 [Yersinia pestis]
MFPYVQAQIGKPDTPETASPISGLSWLAVKQPPVCRRLSVPAKPARTETGRSSLFKFFFEAVYAAEIALDSGFQVTG